MLLLQGSASNIQPVTSGVPQGSVLRPALFLIYINDISVGFNSEIRLFADDALMHLSFSGCDSHIKFQEDLTKLDLWAKKWRMSFNAKKCAVITFGNNREKAVSGA